MELDIKKVVLGVWRYEKKIIINIYIYKSKDFMWECMSSCHVTL